MNVLAANIYRRVRSEDYVPDNIIYGTVYIGNENADDIILFTKADLTYICKTSILPHKFPTDLKSYRIYLIYIYGDHAGNNQRGSDNKAKSYRGAQAVQPRLLPRSQKKASECEHCRKTFSCVNTLRRHQAETNHQVQAAASDGDNREVQREKGKTHRISSGRLIPPLPDLLSCFGTN